MNLRPRQREEPDVSLTPLIDVVFLLLIFFMVSTTFRKESEFKIDLPEATREPVASEPQQTEIAIDIDGRYALNNQPLADKDIATLVAALSALDLQDGDRSLIIRADGKAAHQAVVSAMDAAGQAGFRNIGIVTTHRTARSAAD